MPIIRIAAPVYLPRWLYHPLRRVKRVHLDSKRQPSDTQTDMQDKLIGNALVVFDRPHATKINEARLKHLDSLGLELTNSKVLEVGSGIGLLTGFFENLGCEILSTDARAENVAEHLPAFPIGELK
jgi:2-polyprenyl-3-methyl-5-hydroxy-6-metoxy-1,4-benzoquinol methylase